MVRSSSFSRQNFAQTAAKGVVDFLQLHDKMAGLGPAVARIVALRKDCSAVLPDTFNHCDVLQLESGILVLSASAPVFASRLKQQIPQLQNSLLKRGWEINTIRIKVLISQNHVALVKPKQLSLSPQALNAFTTLNQNLQVSRASTELQDAIARLLRHHQ